MDPIVLRGPKDAEFTVNPGQALAIYEDGREPGVIDIEEHGQVTVRQDDRYLKILNDSVEATKSSSTSIENVLRSIEDLLRHQKTLQRHDPAFDPVMDSMDADTYRELIERPATNDWARELHRAHDELFIKLNARRALARLKRRDLPVVETLPEYKRWENVLRAGTWVSGDDDIKAIRAATWSPGVAGAGAEAVAVAVSSTFIEFHRLPGSILSAFRRITIPQGASQLNIPSLTSAVPVTIVPAATGTTAFAPQGTALINNPATSVLVLNAKKQGTAPMAAAQEEVEDATIAVVEALTSEAVEALMKAQQSAVLNSQPAAGGLDDTTNGPQEALGYAGTAPTGVGLRYWGLVTNANTSDAGGTMTLAEYDAAWSKMGQHGIPAMGNMVASFFHPYAWIDMVGTAEFTSGDNAGRGATLLDGAITTVRGHQVFVTDQIPLTHTDGKVNTTAGLNIKGSVVIANTERWRVGEKRGIDIKMLDDNFSDTVQVRGFARHAVGCSAAPATEDHVAVVINVDA